MEEDLNKRGNMNISLKLETLKLQNFATFKSHDVQFSVGLNAIIGETGSGKSLLLDALELVFGGRADKKSVRHGSDFALVEAVLGLSDPTIGKALDELGFPVDGNQVVIKRMIKKDGTSRCWLNHMSCTLSQIIGFSRKYVDLVGQFENQKLMSENYQLKLLDQYGGIEKDVSTFREMFNKLKQMRSEKLKLESNIADREQRLDYLNYQINEIDSLNPVIGEEERLNELKNDILNVTKKKTLIQQMEDISQGNDQSSGLDSYMQSFRSIINKNKDILTLAFIEKFEAFEFSFEDFLNSIKDLRINEIDEEQIQVVFNRLDLYSKLKRKFGGSVQGILDSRNNFKAEVDQIQNTEISFSDLTDKISALEKEVLLFAQRIHLKRKESANKLSKELTKSVRLLKMDGADIKFDIGEGEEIQENGITKVNFLAQTNPGEGFFKVKEIASGGELSRILLAVRQILSAHDSISIFLFDEIDTGMGGETALHIGKSLKSVSLDSQVIAITHLPQIAAFADKLIVVSKETTEEKNADRTISKVRELEGAVKIKKEIETMIPLQ
jgi:DNA repair protein RecN (Recombination protein N)